MRVAITGASGSIGKHLMEAMSNDYEVIALSRNPDSNPALLNSQGLKMIQTDYSVDSLKYSLKHCDAVIHLAAAMPQKKTADCILKKNVHIDYNVFKACKLNKIINIVFASSRGVYGNSPNVPWTEKTEPNPQNLYSLGKLQSELTAKFFNVKGLSIKSMRIAQIISHNTSTEYALGNFLMKSINKQPLKVYASDDVKREYVYVKDVALAIMAALDKPEQKGVYNFGSGEVVSIAELAELIANQFQNSNNITFTKTINSKTIEYSLMNSSLFYSVFGYKARWNIKNALFDMHQSINTKSTNG